MKEINENQLVIRMALERKYYFGSAIKEIDYMAKKRIFANFMWCIYIGSYLKDLNNDKAINKLPLLILKCFCLY